MMSETMPIHFGEMIRTSMGDAAFAQPLVVFNCKIFGQSIFGKGYQMLAIGHRLHSIMANGH
jgi:hypothetical protein